jgi:predicted amidohydrolase
MANEHEHYSAGTTPLVIDWKDWKLCPLICYDLRFPIWSRNKLINNTLEYDVLIYVANWPQARSLAWNTLLKARAIENLSYCIGVNRVGTDAKGIVYQGDSAVYSPKGETLFHQSLTEITGIVNLSAEELLAFRQQFPAYLDADRFEIY